METRTDFAQHAIVMFKDTRSLHLVGDDFTFSNNSITDGAGESSVPLGFAVEKTVKLELTNYDDRYHDYDFFGARIHLFVRYQLDPEDPDSYESVDYGYYTVVTPETYGETVIVTAVDDMYKADRPFTLGFTSLTAKALLSACCNACNISLAAGDFYNSSMTFSTFPNIHDYSFRQIIGYIAMAACGNARIGYDGSLYIHTYNLTDTPLYTLDKWIGRPQIQTDDVRITGVKMEIETEDSDGNQTTQIVSVGADDYALKIENPFFATTSRAQSLVSAIAVKMIGKTFRAFSGEYIGFPIAEFMDPIQFEDSKGVTHTSFLTDITYTFRGRTEFRCKADDPLRNSQDYTSSSSTYIKARKLVEAERSARETALEVITQRLNDASGLYTTPEVQPDGSTIYYLHNKPTLEESRYIWKMTSEAWAVSSDGGETWNAGIEVNGNVIANILSANGVNADWINAGTLIVRDPNGKIIFSASVGGHSVYISGDNVQIGGEPLASALETIDENAESRARTWYQATDPALEWDNLLDHNGEPILDHNDPPLPFELVSDPGKNGHIGDIWHRISDDPALNDTLWLYTESGWVTNAYATSDDLDTYYNNITQQDIFDKLTNNRQDTGIFLLNGQLYINANYLNVGDGANLYSNYDTMSQIPNDHDAISWRHNCDANGNIQSFNLVASNRISGNSLRIQNKSSVTSSGGYVFLGNSENHYGLVPIRSGKRYRISFFVRAVSSNVGNIKSWLVKTGSWTSQPANSDCYSQGTHSITNNWSRCEFDYVGEQGVNYIGLGFANLSSGLIADICGIMIEEVASATTPSSPFAPAGTTQIDGGSIKTRSISANKISVTDLYALGATIGGWRVNTDSLESNDTWTDTDGVTHPNVKLHKDGSITVGEAVLDNMVRSNHHGSLRIKYGLDLYTKPNDQLSDDTGLFRIYNLTAGSGTAINLQSDNIVGIQSSSSRRYKDPCGLATFDDVSKILDLPVVWFKYKDGYLRKGDRFEGKPMIGLYAEDVYEAMPEAAQINADGQIEDWNHRILIPAMLKLIQSQHDMIQSLEERISKLEKLLMKESD